MTTSWHAILQGELAEAAERTIDEIAQALPELPAGTPWVFRHQVEGALALSTGRVGQALFWAYLARCRGDQDAAEKAVECLEEAIGELPLVPMLPSFFGGYVGTAWASEHLHGQLFDSDGDDPNLEIDQALLGTLDRTSWPGDFDLISGLAGIGVYALERLPRPTAVECLEWVVEHLEAEAVERPDGLAWFTPLARIPPDQRKEFPHGYFNLGVAHGVPGVAAVLAGACAAGVAVDKARPLLDGAVSYVLGTRLPPGEKSCFPTLVAEGREPLTSRLAWCHGDPGVAASLLVAARSVGNAEWEAEALAVAREAARRPLETAGIEDSSLCHGSAGLGHLFNRFYQATGEELFAETARFWFRYALEERKKSGQGGTGFVTYGGDERGEVALREEGGFLTGIAGVGLSLLAATSSVIPDWDRSLLIAIPPRA